MSSFHLRFPWLHHKTITLLFSYVNSSSKTPHSCISGVCNKLSQPLSQKGSILTTQVNKSPNFAPIRRPTTTSALLPAPARPISGIYRRAAARLRYRHCVYGSTKAAMCSRNHLPPESQVKQQISWSRDINLQNFYNYAARPIKQERYEQVFPSPFSKNPDFCLESATCNV